MTLTDSSLRTFIMRVSREGARPILRHTLLIGSWQGVVSCPLGAMRTIEEYRVNAERCRALARLAVNLEEKTVLEELAEA